MSVGPLGGIAGSLAGSPLAQTKGSEIERASQDAGAQQRKNVNELKAEAAAGIGETDGEDHETADRDADGRRLWEETPQSDDEAADTGDTADQDPSTAAETAHPSKDATGQSGNLLDLSG